MSDQTADNTADIVNQATDALRDLQTPEGPPGLLVASTLQAMGVAAQQEPLPNPKRRIAMFQIAKVGLAASALIAAGAVGWLATVGNTSSLAFADVLETIRPIRNAQWKVNSELNGKRYTYEGAATREGLIRNTMPAGGWMVIDTVRAKMLVVDSTKKEATLTEDDRPAHARPGNILARLLELPEEGAEEIGQRKIDGQDTIGFRVRRHNVTTTIWADKKTGLPVRVDGAIEPLKEGEIGTQGGGNYKQTWSDFVYDAELDESFFSLELPAGYKLVKSISDEDAPQQ